ncbi:MAG: ABC transporter permease subunit [Fibrobacteria bacterium]|nr:ABC transporter permease subunit [Fibrobacteria bacterium]
MRNVLAIFKKEFFSYIASPVGFVFIIFYTLVANGFFLIVQDFFRQGQVTMRGYFYVLPWIFLFFVPAITMRLWAEEKKMGSIELLLTMPLTEFQIIFGKFLAAFAFLCVTMSFSITIPITLGLLGDPDAGVILGSYIGAMLMGGAYLAIGLYFSSLTDNQVVAFIFSLVAIFVLLLAGIVPMYLNKVGPIVYVFEYISLLTHFHNVARGVIDTRDVIYYVSIIVLFLFLNIKNIEARKWR